MKKIFFCLLCLCCIQLAQAHVYRITAAAGLDALTLQPGDKVLLTGNNWINQQLVFKGKGTEQQPIVLAVEQPGSIQLTGHSSLKITGSWLVVDGLYFTNGYLEKGDVIALAPGSSHCRLTNTAVVDYNCPDIKTAYQWVSLYGDHNRVDHCWLQGKTHQAPTMVVWLSDTPNYHRIDHNYFGPRPPLGVNGGETIRIGTSTWSMHDSYTTVDDNVFDHCNGELEVISNKSCHNNIYNNLFYECDGSLTLRHGNYATVHENIFIGNGVPGTGGIRIIGENHKVYNNYLQGLTGDGVKSAISMVDGIPNSPLNGYWQVKHPEVTHNTMVRCRQGFDIGVGKKADRYLVPQDGVIAHNLLLQTPPLQYTDTPERFSISGNLVAGAAGTSLPEGFVAGDVKLHPDAHQLLFPENGDAGASPLNAAQQAVLNGEDIGPAWRQKEQYRFVVKL